MPGSFRERPPILFAARVRFRDAVAQRGSAHAGRFADRILDPTERLG